ncbi:MAG TPA: lyase family protein [Burkholderiales bacterium]|nr:lyase family protein [Burkholderiales bacterium]
MARFEGALARASARTGVITPEHADVIAAVCEHAVLDASTLAREARHAGTLTIPFVKTLTKQVAGVSADAARFVHFGATSQDVTDTALALCLRASSERTLALARELGDALAAVARRHARTPIAARTLLQPAAPIPFGWKVAMWLSPLARSLPHYRHASAEASVLQFGGAAGTLSAFGEKGGTVAKELGRELGLRTAVTWHSARDAFARLGSESAILAGIAAKIARDVALAMQPEVGELAEPTTPGRGGSSAMPHKRNPAACMLALEAARRVPGLAATLLNQLESEHERGVGQWQSQFITMRELVCATASALAAMAEVLQGLQVNDRAMLDNLEHSKGLVFSEAVSLRLSRAMADRLVERAVREKKHLAEVMLADAEASRALSREEMAALFNAEKSYGAAAEMTERVLADWASARETAP